MAFKFIQLEEKQPQEKVAEMAEERTNTFSSCLDSNTFVVSMVFIILKYWSSILFLLNPVTEPEVGKKAAFQISFQFRFSFIKASFQIMQLSQFNQKLGSRSSWICSATVTVLPEDSEKFHFYLEKVPGRHCTNELQLLIDKVKSSRQEMRNFQGTGRTSKNIVQMKGIFSPQ